MPAWLVFAVTLSWFEATLDGVLFARVVRLVRSLRLWRLVQRRRARTVMGMKQT
jgi:hypothetical protein